MLCSEWFGDISPGNKCCSRYFVHAVSTAKQVCNLFPMSSGKGFPGSKKSSKLILLMILSGPKLYRKLEFQLRVLIFPLSCFRKTQISLQVFESPLSRHAGCYCPIFEPLILIFEVRGAHEARSGRKLKRNLKSVSKLKQESKVCYLDYKTLINFSNIQIRSIIQIVLES